MNKFYCVALLLFNIGYCMSGFVVERPTRLLCSTLERAKKTSALFCLTAQAVRPMKSLCLDWDGRCRQPHVHMKTFTVSKDIG